MKKSLYLLLVVALVAGLSSVAFAQAGVTWTSGILIQNLGTADASVTVYYYWADDLGGGLAIDPPPTYVIPVGAQTTIYPLDVADGFRGSVVLESTEPIVAIVNQLGDGVTYGGSYEGFDMGSDTVRLPNVQSANSGFYSFFQVQNAGSAATDITVTFIPEPGLGYGTPAVETCTALPPGEACIFSQQPGQGQWTIGKWVGGATVTTSGQPVVASVDIVHEPGTYGMSSYSGFTGAGSLTAVLPNIMNANGTYWSGINVTNGGGTASDVTLTFYPATGYAAIAPVTFTALGAGATGVLLMPNHPDLAGNVKWVGAVVVDGGGNNVFVIVNTLTTVYGEVSAWKGVDPATATQKVVMPAILSDGGGYPFFTGFQVYNTGAAAVDITISYAPCATCSPVWTPVNETGTVPANSSLVFLQSGNGQWTGVKYVGSATVTVTSGTGNIMAIVNELAPGFMGSGEVTYSYNAFNVAP
jgi:hypothetical protein